MRSSFQLCRLFGIEIRIHFAFLLVPLFFGWVYAKNDGLAAGLRAGVLVLSVFTLVVAHELSHSLAAKSYGIRTQRITLYPIGGIASMYRIPRVPWQELLVATAGPFLNFALAAIFFFPLRNGLGQDVFFSPSLDSWKSVLANLYWANLILGVFNMIPAFPMDGGRILRSALALRINYLSATQISVILGKIFAILFAISAVYFHHWMLLLIGIFVFISASNEMTQVRHENLRDHGLDE